MPPSLPILPAHRSSPIAQHPVRGLYAITPDERDTAILVGKVGQALAGGAALVQYRNKSADPALRREQAAALLPVCRGAGVPLIVNDDLDVALRLGADGLHLGREDGDVARARTALGAAKLIGVSCYDRLELGVAARAKGADYVAFGAAFASPTKPAAVHATLDLYREARMRLVIPIVAIGGITPENARAVIDAGADAIAVITALFDAPDIRQRAAEFARLFP